MLRNPGDAPASLPRLWAPLARCLSHGAACVRGAALELLVALNDACWLPTDLDIWDAKNKSGKKESVSDVHIHTHIYIYLHLQIYTERERARESERG